MRVIALSLHKSLRYIFSAVRELASHLRILYKDGTRFDVYPTSYRRYEIKSTSVI